MKRISYLVVGLALLLGCGEGRVTENGDTSLRPGDVPAMTKALGAAVEQDLATLRRVTAPFHDFEAAGHAGWMTQITPCMTDPGGAGGMGFHYGNTTLIDGTAHVETPQLLLYEPEKNGRFRLVAVEYIIPYSFHRRDAAPPRLFNQNFQQVDAFQLWGLHAWVWRDNPSGMFASWNPRVNCDNTTAVSTMSHN
jgi:hypothetical protein